MSAAHPGEDLMKRLMVTVLAGAVVACGVALAQAGAKPGWIGTWTASAQPAWSSDFPVPLGLPANLYQKTIRQVMRISIGGSKVRVVLSNEYGKLPLKVDAAHVALQGDEVRLTRFSR
jgi:hypothetical protein